MADAEVVVSYVQSRKKRNVRIDWNNCGALVHRSARYCYDLYRSRVKYPKKKIRTPEYKKDDKRFVFTLMHEDETSIIHFGFLDEYL